MNADPLVGFHPLLRAWFEARYGEPTSVQAQAWPLIAAGGHVLASAPTGSGKTLTAFLDAISRFADGSLNPQKLSVLYVSPLKALNEDIRVNLLGPLRELASSFSMAGADFPRIRVATRSGDTPPAERRRTLSDPPSILCTTPESLAILLSSKRGLELLSGLRLVILDEVHALLGNKRGTLLACSIGRLVGLAGEFQRVALSATVRPFDVAAAFVGGRRLDRGADGAAIFTVRPVHVVEARGDKRYMLSVEWPPEPMFQGESGSDGLPASRYNAISLALAGTFGAGRPTIVFTDSRRRAERMAALLNELAGEGTAWAHHGSLSREVRHAVEERLRRGTLPCVVATGTLELGIDIGSVDRVILAGTPSRADQVLQRVGRAGHAVGQPSRGVFYPFHGMDLLQAAAAVGTVLDGDVDLAMIPESPLDVLAQVLLSMVLFSSRRLDELYDEVRSFSPYTGLSREDFDSVVGMLAGRYRETRLKELAARVYLDSENDSIRAREGAAMLLYSSGGSIPDRGYYAMRIAGAGNGGASGAKIGELDEEFVFERQVGNSFAFGSQAWKIVSIGDEAVEVVPLDREADFLPFWKADKAPRGLTITNRMLELCAARDADPEEFQPWLTGNCGFSAEAAAVLASWLDRQKRAQRGGRLPSPSSIAMEICKDASAVDRGASTAVMLHTLRGSPVNEPLGLALVASLEERTGLPIERLGDDDSILFILPLASPDEAENLVMDTLTRLGSSGQLAGLVRNGLESTGAFGAAFRENAGRALLLPRSGFGKRTPLWVTRLKAKRLFAKVKDAGDFPIIAESWRTVLQGRFDLPGVAALCDGLCSGDIELVRYRTTVPSPFASRLGWAETKHYLYNGDELGSSNTRGSDVRSNNAVDDAIEQALGNASLRPEIPAALATGIGEKLRRELQGWAPDSPDALADWVDERVFIPMDEWEALLDVCDPGLAAAARTALLEAGTGPEGLSEEAVVSGNKAARGAGLLSRLAWLRFPGSATPLVIRRERKKALLADPAAFIGEWLRSSGPVPLYRLSELLGSPLEHIHKSVSVLEETGTVIADQASFNIAGLAKEPWICDRDVLDGLLRSVRRAARPSIRPRPALEFPSFVAFIHGLGAAQKASFLANGQEGSREALERALDLLSGYPAKAGLWETEIVPARFRAYRREDIDHAINKGDWLWFGSGRGSVAFARPEEIALFITAPSSPLLPPGSSFSDVWHMKDLLGLSLDELQAAVWKDVWRGALSSDSFEAVRKGVQANFLTDGLPGSREEHNPAHAGLQAYPGRRLARPRIPLALRDRWKQGSPLPGRWFGLGMEALELDEADELDVAADRVRIVARRYGMVARFLLERELPLLGWSKLFSAIRRLELSGELIAGQFFDGIGGPQFMAREVLPAFRDGAGMEGPWTVNAFDPASPLAMDLPDEIWPGSAPSRVPTTRVTSQGSAIACVSRRSYHELDIAVDPGSECLPAILEFLTLAKGRAIDPVQRIILEKINGQAASASPYVEVLRSLGFERDRSRMVLW